MFKKIKLFTLLLILFLTIGISCSEKMIDIPPVNPSEADYFKTEPQFTAAVFGVYARLTDLYNFNTGTGSNFLPITFLPGDDVTVTGQNAFEHFSQLEPSNGRISNYWTKIYQMVGRANIVLAKIATEQGVYKTAGLKNTHTGEALFLRGYAFYLLWNSFAKAPVVTERVASTSELNQPESKGTELLDQAIKDFGDAAGLLPASWGANDRGRVSKNSANGFLGKCLVFRGTEKKAAADFTAAIAAFNAITGVALVPNFGDNFAYDTENNGESLFEFQASQPGFDNVWLPNEFDGAVGTMSGYWGFFYTGNNHNNDNINFIATNKLYNKFDAADPRRDLTVNATKALIKYTRKDVNSQSGVGSINNARILRYADVLLLKAEAILQSNGSTAEAIGLINQVRTRARNMVAGGTVPANLSTAQTDKTVIMQWIMDERLVELAAEGQRWYDLTRWHRAGYITLSNAFFDPVNAAVMAFTAPKHLLLPIPLSETDKNPNVVGNNPGY